MRVAKQTDRYVILDDVLPPEQFELMVVLGRALLPEKRHMRSGRVETVKETWDVLTKEDRNAPFARAAVAGFFLGEADDTPFWR